MTPALQVNLLVIALRKWKCPACNGSRYYSGYSKNSPGGTPCRKCANTDGLHPVAHEALKEAGVLKSS